MQASFEVFFEAYICEEATPAELSQFESLLRTDPEMRRRFAEEIQVEVDLINACQFVVAERLALNQFNAPNKFSRRLFKWAAAASMVATLVIGFLIIRPRTGQPVAGIELLPEIILVTDG